MSTKMFVANASYYGGFKSQQPSNSDFLATLWIICHCLPETGIQCDLEANLSELWKQAVLIWF